MWRQLNCSDSTRSNQTLLKEETKKINEHKNTMLAFVSHVSLIVISQEKKATLATAGLPTRILSR